MTSGFVLAIDQGTSGTKCLIMNRDGQEVCKVTEPLRTSYLENGFVEQVPEEIFQSVLAAVANCIAAFENAGYNRTQIVSCGISNQRETFVLWDAAGNPLYNAVVWQCKRSTSICEQLKEHGTAEAIKKRTGLLTDPYFSGTKVMWLAQENEEIRTAIEAGNAFFGTVDSWVLYKLTSGRSYATDYSNASRTLFFNLRDLCWDKELLSLFGLTNLQLPQLYPSAAEFGASDFGGLFPQSLPITAMIGDSHAAAFGEGCFEKGEGKATLGTGCSILVNAGTSLPDPVHGCVTTICWSLENEVHYAIEGVIISCGAIVEWLRKELRLFDDVSEVEKMVEQTKDNNGVFIIPALSGLGSPHWDMNRKAEILGLTFDSNRTYIVRAALETVGFQVKEIIDHIERKSDISLSSLAVNGGLTSSSFVVDFLATLLGQPLYFGARDASARGAAYLSGLKSGLFSNRNALKEIMEKKKAISPAADSKYPQQQYLQWLSLMTRG